MSKSPPVPVITEVMQTNNIVSKKGTIILPFEYAETFYEIVRESAKAKNIEIPDSVFLTKGEVYYGDNEIKEVRLQGFDRNTPVPKDGNLLENPFVSELEPAMVVVEKEGKGFIQPEQAERKHLAFYLLATRVIEFLGADGSAFLESP